jgi:hypothetical protein
LASSAAFTESAGAAACSAGAAAGAAAGAWANAPAAARPSTIAESVIFFICVSLEEIGFVLTGVNLVRFAPLWHNFSQKNDVMYLFCSILRLLRVLCH